MAMVSLDILLARGDVVSVERGRLVITPASGRPVPPEWLAKYGRDIVLQAAKRTGVLALIYTGYSVGNYSKHLAGGVALQFAELASEKSFFAVFNAETKRARSTKHGKAGDPLPQRQFRVLQHSAFFRLWQSTGLPFHRLSDFHERMGLLSPLIFTGHITEGEKLTASKVSLLSLPPASLADKHPKTSRQVADNRPTRTADKESLHGQQSQGLQSFLTTGGKKCGNTVNSDTGNGRDSIPVSVERDSSITDWLADYERAPDFSPKCIH